MRRLAAVLTFAVLLPCTARAQSTVEIGTGIGAAINFNGGSITQIGIPGPGVGVMGLLGQAPIYASFFVGDGFMVQPEVAFNLLTGEGETITSLGSALNLGYAFNGAGANSPYVTVNGALQWIDVGGDVDGGSETDFGAGARVGYRFVVNQGFATSFEVGFRRWFDNEYNELSFGLRLGGILSAPK